MRFSSKNHRVFLLFLPFFVFSFFSLPKPVFAVIPPDFLFNVGSQIIHIFSLILLFFTTIFGLFYQFIKIKFLGLKSKKSRFIYWAVSVFVIIVLAGGISYLYGGYQQKVEYEKWLTESEKYQQPLDLPKETLPLKKEPELETPAKKIVTNQDFKKVLEGEQKNYLILDAREDVEFENGHIPGSFHLRFADLTSGKWTEIPADKTIYVVCWSGLRGKEIAEFLERKKFKTFYLETGVDGWVNFGGVFDGEVKFSHKYSQPQFQLVFSTEEVKEKVGLGVKLVDCREPARFQQDHIEGSINVPIIYTPTVDLEKVFNQILPQSKVITVCDNYINCFDAKVTGVELEKRGYKFLGRYNKPWEYNNN